MPEARYGIRRKNAVRRTLDDRNDKPMITHEKKLDSDSGQRTVKADKPDFQEAARPHEKRKKKTMQQ